MKKILFFLFTITLQYSYGQIQNYDFEIWEPIFGYEQPQNWYCNGYSFGACTKVNLDISNKAVRMDNSLPCIDSSNPKQSSRLGNGDLTQRFKVPSIEFTLSYDLIIDSVDMPAAFRVRLFGDGIGAFFDVKHSELFNGNVSHNIIVDSAIDSLLIHLEPEGYEKEMAEHECDLGYISVIIDNVKVEKVVKVNEIKNHRMTIYPNPSLGLVYFEQGEIGIKRVEVYDCYGRFLQHKMGKGEELMKMNLSELGTVLFLRIIYENEDFEMKRLILN